MRTGKRRAAPVQIRSDALQAQLLCQQVAQRTGITAFPVGMAQAEPPAARRGGRGGAWRERDLRRALAVARMAGLRDYRVEIAPDGTISIVVGGA